MFHDGIVLCCSVAAVLRLRLLGGGSAQVLRDGRWYVCLVVTVLRQLRLWRGSAQVFPDCCWFCRPETAVSRHYLEEGSAQVFRGDEWCCLGMAVVLRLCLRRGLAQMLRDGCLGTVVLRRRRMICVSAQMFHSSVVLGFGFGRILNLLAGFFLDGAGARGLQGALVVCY